jgi:hypothetical protein
VITRSNTAYSLGGFEQGFDVFDESVSYGEEWNWQWRNPEGVIEKPAVMRGQSLVPLIHGRDPVWRSYAISESPFADKKALITGKWKYIYTPGTRPLNPVLRIERAPGRSLHNLEDDPRELHDVYGENPEIGGRLHAILLRLLPEAERARLAVKKGLEVRPDVVEQLKSLGYLQ